MYIITATPTEFSTWQCFSHSLLFPNLCAILLCIEFNQLERSIFVLISFVSTHSDLDVICGRLGMFPSEPWIIAAGSLSRINRSPQKWWKSLWPVMSDWSPLAKLQMFSRILPLCKTMEAESILLPVHGVRNPLVEPSWKPPIRPHTVWYLSLWN